MIKVRALYKDKTEDKKRELELTRVPFVDEEIKIDDHTVLKVKKVQHLISNPYYADIKCIKIDISPKKDMGFTKVV